MESVLTMLLIRFGLIAGGLVLLALIGFAVALLLRRRGRLDGAREKVAPLAKGAVRLLADRGRVLDGRDSRGRGLSGELVRAAARYLADNRARGGDRR